jgi:hypothetical protein
MSTDKIKLLFCIESSFGIDIYDPNLSSLTQLQHAPKKMSNRIEGTTIEERLQIAAGWVKNCVTSHSECTRTTQGHSFPSRILDLSKVQSVGSLDPVTLIDSGLLRDKYATLSYCWGKLDPMKTTKSALESIRRGIPVNSLPKTFRDAVRVCLVLDIMYLWIDSLCIVQDDL